MQIRTSISKHLSIVVCCKRTTKNNNNLAHTVAEIDKFENGIVTVSTGSGH